MTAVYKREMNRFFKTPTGYVIAAVFIFAINIMVYMNNVFGGYGNLSSMFQWIMILLIILSPLLTMRTFAEEYRQKTDRLLLTSPTSISGIVMGKFFALATVYLFVLALTIPWVMVVTLHSVPSIASIAGGYISIFLAGLVFLSIGMFVSSLTENQAVSAIVSLLIFVALYIIDAGSGYISISYGSSFLTMLLDWLSIFSRYETFLNGLFPLDGTVFYLSFAALFVFLTVRSVEKKRWM